MEIPMLGTGRAVAIAPRDYAVLAADLGCDPAVLEAIANVESNGFGWFPDGRIKILFEKHWFYKLVPSSLRATAIKAKVARKDWVSPKDGGYKDQAAPQQRYDLLATAITLNSEAAYQSISIGRFQIMGFNHDLCGYATAKAMFDAFCDSEANQLAAFANFLKGKKLVPALIARDFDKIETVYNGGGQNGAYAKRMREEYVKLSKDRGRYETAKPVDPIPPPPDIEPIPAPEGMRETIKPGFSPGAAVIAIVIAVAAAAVFFFTR
jgi:hypothetical protein